MKRKAIYIFLGAEAVFFTTLACLHVTLAGAFSAVVAFPFEQIGLGLRALSLSGAGGNVAAIALYAALCLSPLLLAVRRERRRYPEDTLLVALCALLFRVLYLMINPGDIAGVFMVADQTVGKAVLGGTVWSVAAGYAILRALRTFYKADGAKLHRYLKGLLYALAALFVYVVTGVCLGDFVAAVAQVGGQDMFNLGPTYLFLALRLVVDALPYVLDVVVAFAAVRLVEGLLADQYAVETVAAAGRLSRLCGVSLAATVCANVAFNLLQLLCARSLLVVDSWVNIPVASIAFVVAALVLARYIRDNKALKDDADLFI